MSDALFQSDNLSVMMMSGFSSEIVSGAVAGITAGVVLKVLDWLANRYWFRRAQIRYLRTLLEKERENIYSCRTIPHPEPEQPDIPANQTRLAIYRHMKSEIVSLLQERPTYMSYDQRRSIEHTFVTLDLIQNRGRLAPLAIYKHFFNGLEDMPWLGLAHKQPGAGAEE